MVTAGPKRLPSWGDSVREILRHAEKSVAEVAKRLGVARTITHRHLNGERAPSGEDVERINLATAEVVGSPDVYAYLQSIVGYERAVEDGVWPAKAALEGFDLALSGISAYLKEGAKKEIVRQLLQLPHASQSKIFYGAAALVYKRLIRRIDGDIPRAIFVDDLCDLCLHHGLDLRHWFRPQDETSYERREDEFELAVQRAIAEPGILDIRTRNQIERKILKAFNRLRRQDLEESRLAHWKSVDDKNQTIDKMARIALGDAYREAQ